MPRHEACYLLVTSNGAWEICSLAHCAWEEFCKLSIFWCLGRKWTNVLGQLYLIPICGNWQLDPFFSKSALMLTMQINHEDVSYDRRKMRNHACPVQVSTWNCVNSVCIFLCILLYFEHTIKIQWSTVCVTNFVWGNHHLEIGQLKSIKWEIVGTRIYISKVLLQLSKLWYINSHIYLFILL